MKTSKPFATISYNTAPFLESKLADLITQGSIEFYAFIEHLPEEDETKAHKHLYVVPSGRIDTEQLREYLTEIDLQKPAEKPLKCLPCKSSKFADWYLYGLHDARYLASKGQSRKLHYTQEEFKTSDADFFNEEIHTIDFSKLNRVDALVNAVESNVPFSDLVRLGMIPLQQFVGYQRAYELLSNCKTYRNQRPNHETDQVIDLETGEVSFEPQTVIAFETALETKQEQLSMSDMPIASKPKVTED